MQLLKRFCRFIKVSFLVTAVLVGGITAINSGRVMACTPDPTVPLKCFCEKVEADLTAASTGDKNICELNKSDKDKDAQEGLLGKNGIVKKVFNLMSWLTGLLAAVYLIIGGAKIIVSGGSSDSVSSGKKMIIYALVGIVVVVSSNLIINFVLGLVNNASK